MCAVLGVSKSGYFAWRKREPSARAREDERLGERIVEIHDASRGTYGVPRIHAELKEEGVKIGRKRVAKLMKANDIQGVSRRKGYKTTVKGRDRHGIPDLVERNFTATAPDQLWVADITYVPTWSGFVFLAVVLDVFCAPHRHEGCRLVHGHAPAHGAGAGRAEHGHHHPQARGRRASLGSGLPVHLHRLRPALQEARRSAVGGLCG